MAKGLELQLQHPSFQGRVYHDKLKARRDLLPDADTQRCFRLERLRAPYTGVDGAQAVHAESGHTPASGDTFISGREGCWPGEQGLHLSGGATGALGASAARGLRAPPPWPQIPEVQGGDNGQWSWGGGRPAP